MKNHKRLLSLVLTFVMTLSLSIPAFAAVEETGFSDVDAGAWYAEAVIYCREHELMGGIGDNRFAPESSLTRAQLATVLYRIEGEPAVAGTDAFSDTADGAWYSDAVYQGGGTAGSRSGERQCVGGLLLPDRHNGAGGPADRRACWGRSGQN